MRKISREVYLDNSATTMPLDVVIDEMNRVFRDVYGNPSSLHSKGIEAERVVKTAREKAAAVINASAPDIIFTSGGTEANNLAIRGYLEANHRKGRHIITTKIEHPSVLNLFKELEARGYTVEYIEADKNGIVDAAKFEAVIKEDTALISIMHVNNETGAIQPIEDVITIKNRINKECAVHIDCIQSYGKMDVNVKKLSVDMMTASAHKIHGPKGMGMLYIKKGTRIKPLIYGGGQESDLRPGTENVPGIAGFGVAAENALQQQKEAYKHVKSLRAMLVDGLAASIPDCKINSPVDERGSPFISVDERGSPFTFLDERGSPYILNVSFKGVHSEVLLHTLEARRIYISTGSACSSRKNIYSHVLSAMGIEREELGSAVRFSFSRFNTEEDIEYTLDILKEAVPTLRKYKRR